MSIHPMSTSEESIMHRDTLIVKAVTQSFSILGQNLQQNRAWRGFVVYTVQQFAL